jgi:hypothetical protein
MMKYSESTLPIKSLLLDPNNFRYQDEKGFVTADEKRFGEQSVQDRASRRLRKENLPELKRSIITNGFLPIERLVVRPYSYADGRYLVVEGNRRLAALKWIEEDHEAGVEVPEEILSILHNVPVVVIPDGSDESTYLSIMGIRHVGGIRQWGGYQRAKLVTDLRDDFGLDPGEVAERLGLSTQEINRRYRAFKALGQMQVDPEYGERSDAAMYAVFHEAVAIPIVREWLGWNESTSQFENDEDLHQFYDLIAPADADDGSTRQAKITTFSQVRQLRSILPLPEAKRVLLNPDRDFDAALGIAKADELNRSWGTQVAETVAALKSIGWDEVGKLTSDDLEEIRKLRQVVDNLLNTHDKLA